MVLLRPESSALESTTFPSSFVAIILVVLLLSNFCLFPSSFSLTAAGGESVLPSKRHLFFRGIGGLVLALVAAAASLLGDSCVEVVVAATDGSVGGCCWDAGMKGATILR